MPLIIMIKINIECVFKYFLYRIKQTDSKYGEVLVHSDGASKHCILLMWKVLEKQKVCFLFLSKVLLMQR